MSGLAGFSAYSGRTVLVTGATGFIGGGIVERLALEHGAEVRALVRSFGRAARLARLPVQLTYGELGDAASLSVAVAGCDVVIHAAFDWQADGSKSDRVDQPGRSLPAAWRAPSGAHEHDGGLWNAAGRRLR